MKVIDKGALWEGMKAGDWATKEFIERNVNRLWASPVGESRFHVLEQCKRLIREIVNEKS